MRIYTRRGDQGETGLGGGRRVAKDSLRVEAYGTVDELSASLGLATALLRERLPVPLTEGQPTESQESQLVALLCRLQSDLLVAGADLAAPPEDRTRRAVPRILAASTEELERQIDRYEDLLPPLRNFILRTGTPAAAALHLACTVCRRAERRVLSLSREEEVNPELVRYLNRLSDLLFTLARAVNALQGGPEIPWSAP